MGNSHILLTKFFLRGQPEDHNLEQKVFSLHILHCASNVGAELFHQETTSQLQSAPPIKHTVRLEGHGCQMAIARFLDCMGLALWA